MIQKKKYPRLQQRRYQLQKKTEGTAHNKKDITDFNMDKVIKELNDQLDCDNSKNQGVKKMQC